MSEDYIARKIENCKKLIETALSPEQKKIYKSYYQYWKEKIKVPPEEELIESTQTITDDLVAFSLNPAEINATILDLGEVQKAAEFENKYPPKKAYYIRDGISNKTKAFQEFLKNKDVE